MPSCSRALRRTYIHLIAPALNAACLQDSLLTYPFVYTALHLQPSPSTHSLHSLGPFFHARPLWVITSGQQDQEDTRPWLSFLCTYLRHTQI